MSYFYDLPEPKDSFLVPEIAERMARVASRMEEDALTAEVIRVLRGRGYTVTAPGAIAPSPSDAASAPAVPDTLARVRELHRQWEDETREWYYDNRYTHEHGIDYVAGYEDGWNHADELLGRVLDGGEAAGA